MKVKLYDFIKENKDLVENGKVDKQHLEYLLVWISFFQHERFVHLLVTVFVGICAVMFLVASLFIDNIFLILLFLILVALFVPYIFHYYNLENGVQKLYDIYNDGYNKLNK